MIQGLPPPPPAVECVAPESAKTGAAYVTVSGDPAQLQALLTELNSYWVVDAQAENNGVGFARIKGDLNVPYKAIGSLIFQAQRRQLAVAFYTRPVLCGSEF